MGTPMAVNFANLFMGEFEKNLLAEYELTYQQLPYLFLRFIDDVFIIWTGSESDLKRFINFCDSYSTKKNMRSKIRFTHHYSTSEVNFLDMKVKISPSGQIITDLYSKPVDTHTYLHSSSFHPPSLLASIPKTQFIRLRRICTNITDYNRNATNFIQFFIKRGYKSMKLVTIAQEVAAMDRATLLQPKPRAPSPSTNTPALVITWHPKLRSLAGLIKNSHQKYTNQHTKLKETFPEPPIVAYKRNKTLKNILVHARFGKKTSKIPPLPYVNSTLLQSQMSSKTVLNNKLSGVTVQTAGGSATDKNVVYAAECKRCGQIYVGQTSRQLNIRFNEHRSDVSNQRESKQLVVHHYNNGCSFDQDLEVHILQRNLTGSKMMREAQEDKWIGKLNTIVPNGLNKSYSELGKIKKLLFD